MPSTRFDIRVAHRIEEIGQETWDHLAQDRAFASYHWHRFGELVLSKDLPIYIVLLQDGEGVAGATFWLKKQEQIPISSRVARYFIDALLRRWPLFVCRAPVAEISGLLLPNSPLRDEALETIIQVAQAQAKQNRASFLLFDYLSSHETLWNGWPSYFTPAAISDPGTCLVLTWPDFESYLNHLPKSVRNDYRRHRNRAADLGIEIRCHSQVTRLEEALKLIHTVEKHHHTSPKPWARMMLANAHRVDATWLTAEIEGRLVGCGLLLKEGNFAFLTLLGRDYKVEYVYFQLVYAGIRCAIEKGVHVLFGGSGAYPLKQRLGFQQEDNNYVVYTTNNRGFRWLSRRLKV